MLPNRALLAALILALLAPFAGAEEPLRIHSLQRCGDLLARVWGYDYLGDSRLVDIQIYRIRQKLSTQGCGQQLVTVRGVGFRLLP